MDEAPKGTIVVERLRGHLLNGSFTRALEVHGHWRVVAIDLVPRLRRRPVRLAAMAAAAIASYGKGIVQGRYSARDALFRTPTAMRIMRHELLEAIGELAVTPPFVTLQVQSMFDGHMPGVPHFVYTDHTHLANLTYPTFDARRLFSQRWIDAEQRLYEHADACFVRSPHVADSLVHDYGVDPDRVVFAYAGPNCEPTATARPGDSKDIVFIGVDWERKGGPALAEAFARVRKQHRDATLTVIGCTPPPQPGMRVLGRIPVDEVSGHLARAGIFCLPTKVEPFGIAIIEAMLHGLPIVSTRVGAVPDIVDVTNAVLVDPDDIDALAAALATLLDSAGGRAAAGRRSLDVAKARYRWHAVVERMAPHLDAALAMESVR